MTVADDGRGMAPEDLKRCALRHTTSKIASETDLWSISTMGFRGEALPSIAAVSRLTLTTRPHGADTAGNLQITGGIVESKTECVSDLGTTVEVSDLFFNTPARKKFLKSDVAEYNAIADIFNTLALACQDVSFVLNRNDMEAANYPTCSNLLQRIEQLYACDFSQKLYPIEAEKLDFRVTGYIGSPENTRVNRTGQKFFINSRPVQAFSLSRALGRAYEEFIQPKRFPVAILFLEIDHAFIDVNVHPTKKTVRIRTESFFQDILVRTIRKRLREKGFSFDKTVLSGTDSHPGKGYYTENNRPVTFRRLKEATTGYKANIQVLQPSKEKTTATLFSPEHTPQNLLNQEKEAGMPFGVVRILGQVLGTYIIVETEDGFIVFDQHAVHERILYEELLDSFDRGPSVAQQIIFPVTLHLTIQESPLMEEYLQDFQKIGFNINPLGRGTFSIDAVPICMSEGDAKNILKDSLHELMERPVARSFESRQHELAAILACKSYSIKGGKMLDIQEMEHLIKQLGTQKNPHTCPHGRPTFFRVTKDELEKRFKRK